MFIFHSRFQRAVTLLAAGTLEGDEAARAKAHLDRCPDCQALFTSLRTVVRVLEADPAREETPDVSPAALATRIRARLNEEEALKNPVRARPLTRPAVALGVLSLSLALVVLTVGLPTLTGVATRSRSPDPKENRRENPAVDAGGAPEASVTAEATAAFLDRLHREQVRASAARYLSEAQAVFVHVSASGPVADCLVGETEKSRALLKRRAELMTERPDDLASARAVLEDVEGVLRQVAELPRCPREHSGVGAIRADLARKRLMMKIDLVTQELAS